MNKEIDSLWIRISLGDEKAFDSLFRESFPFLLKFACRILHNESDAEEVVQDVFINLWQNKDRITIKNSVKSYLYQSVHNLSINKLVYFKTKKNQPNHLVSQEQWVQIHNSYFVEETFINIFEANETEEYILKFISKLPTKCREVFLLSRYENLTNQEIAERLQLSESTVRVQIFRAIEYLKILMETKFK